MGLGRVSLTETNNRAKGSAQQDLSAPNVDG